MDVKRPLQSICVYSSSSDIVDPVYFELATALGAAIGGRGDRLVFGGSSTGMMGVVARAVKDHGGEVIGVIPEVMRGTPTLFGRAERQENDELFGHGEEEAEEDHHGEVFNVGKISLGYVYDVLLGDSWKAGVGSLVSLALIPSELEDEYGETPVSWMVFLRTRM